MDDSKPYSGMSASMNLIRCVCAICIDGIRVLLVIALKATETLKAAFQSDDLLDCEEV